MSRYMGWWLALLLALCGFAASAGASEAKTGRHTVVLEYDDDTRLVYDLGDLDEHPHHATGDIPIGGISDVSAQVYCVDPFVPFHSLADDPDSLVDTMDGYTVAAPWVFPSVTAANIERLRWLILNGYHEDYLADTRNADDSPSMQRLRGYYPAIAASLTPEIALMATKVAVWDVVAGNQFRLDATSLDPTPDSPDPTRRNTFDTLVDGMLADANTRTRGLEMTEFTLHIDDTLAVSGIGADGAETYGPLTISATLTDLRANGAGDPLIDRVYLELSGSGASTASLVPALDTGAAPLPTGTLYGMSGADPRWQLSYLTGSAFSASGADAAIWRSAPFYVKVPAGTTALPTLTARAMADNVPLLEGTPILFTAERGGVQDWDAVQAFIGAAAVGVNLNMYAVDQLTLTRTTPGTDNPGDDNPGDDGPGEETPGGKEGRNKDGVPETGDAYRPGLWLVSLGAAFAALGGLIARTFRLRGKATK